MDYLCPNCVTPWKCNGPHIPEGHEPKSMMDELNKDFAEELMRQYGEDRFYHCCLRTSNDFSTAEMWLMLNWKDDLTTEENYEDCIRSLNNLGIRNVPTGILGYKGRMEPVTDHVRSDMCRIAFGFCRWWKEYGLRTHKLPAHLHARMVLGDNNEWVKNYMNLLETYPEW